MTKMNDNNQIIIYQTEDGQTRVDVRMENDTVWLTQAQMVELFKSSRTNIVEHIQHIYDEEELDEISTCRKFRQVRQEGKRMVSVTNQLKNDYLNAMIVSHTDSRGIRSLLQNALTYEVDSRETFMKGIDYSYYYEQTD